MELRCCDLPKKPIVWTGGAPITISNLDRDLSLPLKSVSPDQPPGWNDPSRSGKRAGGPSDKRLVTLIFREVTGKGQATAQSRSAIKDPRIQTQLLRLPAPRVR